MITPYFSNLVANIVLTCPKSQDTLYNLTFFNNLWKSSKTLLPFFPLNNNFHPNMVTHQLIPWENTVHAQVPSFKFQMDFEKWIFRDLGMNRRLEMHENDSCIK